MDRCAFAVLAAFIASAAAAQAPEEATDPQHTMEMSKALAAGGDWSGAINAYTDYLESLTTREFRDKKTFAWLLDEFEKQATDGKPDYDALKDIAKAKLPKSSREKINTNLVWRLHLLLADIALKQDNPAEARQALDKAIQTYPDVPYGEPATQSRLQHLYNEAALLRAEEEPAAALTYLLDSFFKDKRFDFVYLPPWKKFYEDAGTPDQYDVLVTRVLDAYAQKAKDWPAEADMLTHYRRQLELDQPDPQSP